MSVLCSRVQAIRNLLETATFRFSANRRRTARNLLSFLSQQVHQKVIARNQRVGVGCLLTQCSFPNESSEALEMSECQILYIAFNPSARWKIKQL